MRVTCGLEMPSALPGYWANWFYECVSYQGCDSCASKCFPIGPLRYVTQGQESFVRTCPCHAEFQAALICLCSSLLRTAHSRLTRNGWSFSVFCGSADASALYGTSVPVHTASFPQPWIVLRVFEPRPKVDFKFSGDMQFGNFPFIKDSLELG